MVSMKPPVLSGENGDKRVDETVQPHGRRRLWTYFVPRVWCVHARARVRVWVGVWVWVCVCALVCVCVPARLCVCGCVRAHAHLCVSECVCARARACVSGYVCRARAPVCSIHVDTKPHTPTHFTHTEHVVRRVLKVPVSKEDDSEMGLSPSELRRVWCSIDEDMSGRSVCLACVCECACASPSEPRRVTPNQN